MPDAPSGRPLTPDEIRALEARGSRADDWSQVRVAEGFSPQAVAQVRFSGPVRLGAFRQPVVVAGVPLPSGVYDSQLHAVNVADGALVSRVGLLANYDVGRGAAVCNCASVTVEGETTFGNGVKLEVFNEGGGREIPLFERLSAQWAYLAATYRHRPKLVAALERMAESCVAKRRARRGVIGEGAQVLNTNSLRNVAVGPAAVVDGAARLENGTLLSKAEAPARVGAGVIASDFVFATGSVVDGGAILSRCFVGQASRVGRQFSGENCAFFANCEAFHGEAVAVLAGPYSVTHHKSTLLIAGLMSFFNAGSNTNQSNHMYKLGPIHQGILERGSKTGSSSYLLWPARAGAFTVVIGKHYANFDTRNLPFSYLYEEEGRSVLTPAVNLFTVGTKRDGDKWPARDRRQDPEKLDLIHFPVFSPFSMGRMMKGLAEIKELYGAAPREQVYVPYNGIQIKRLLCRTALKQYDIGLKMYLGGLLAARVEAGGMEALRAGAPGPGAGEWVDLLGLLAPRTEVESLCDAIESGAVADLAAFEARLKSLHAAYAQHEWAWAQEAWRAWGGKAPAEMNAAEVAQAVSDWEDASAKLNHMILLDAEKEFLGSTRIGFGPDGDASVRDKDFEAVRGTFEGNKFVKELKRASEEVAARADRITAKLKA